MKNASVEYPKPKALRAIGDGRRHQCSLQGPYGILCAGWLDLPHTKAVLRVLSGVEADRRSGQYLSS